MEVILGWLGSDTNVSRDLLLCKSFIFIFKSISFNFLVLDLDTGDIEFYCGATVISNKYVLTVSL